MSKYRDAVGIMIVNPQKKILLGYRAWTQNSQYHWQMPQGGIDAGETPQQAVWREMYEETGLTPATCQMIGESQNWYSYDIPKSAKRKIDGERQKWFLFLFTGTNKDVNLKIQKKPEFIRFRWAEPTKAPHLIIPFKKQVYTQVLAEFMPIIEKISGVD
ncbi:MAG: RNA pyrophosphohydrolase [Alphaproteobacteria bacterium]